MGASADDQASGAVRRIEPVDDRGTRHAEDRFRPPHAAASYRGVNAPIDRGSPQVGARIDLAPHDFGLASRLLSNVACHSFEGHNKFVSGLSRAASEEVARRLATAMTARRLTMEQQRAATQLRALAAPYRFRVVVDAEGFPTIPGRYGQIEWYCDGVNCWSCALPRRIVLAVHTDHSRVFLKLWAIPGVMHHQTGDTEIRAVFGVELLGKVARVIRAKRWGGSGRGRSENFTLTPGQPAISNHSELRNARSQG
jgi:hypothetical protein